MGSVVGADALDAELLDLVAVGGVELALEVDEPLLAIGEDLQQLVLGLAEQRRELGGDARRVLDQERVGEDGRGVLGDRELEAVPVADRAAPGGDGEVLLLLGHRPLLERAGLDRAEPGGAHDHGGEQDQEDGEEQADPALDQPHRLPRRSDGACRCSCRVAVRVRPAASCRSWSRCWASCRGRSVVVPVAPASCRSRSVGRPASASWCRSRSGRAVVVAVRASVGGGRGVGVVATGAGATSLARLV